MFNAIIPLAEPIVAVQVDVAVLDSSSCNGLLETLEKFFMRPVVLVAWDQNGCFKSVGYPCSEHLLIDEDLHWREFELPSDPEVPF